MTRRIVEAHGEKLAAGIFFDAVGDVHEWESKFQKLCVFENANFGTVLTLDGLVMTTDLDAPFYHEPLVHPALTAHPDPKKVLVIGGGDGGTVTELCRYEQLERIVMVEIDEEVVKAGKRFFPELSKGFADPRLELLFDDGARYVRESDELFDVIIVDGSDPVGPATTLFKESFLQACAARLSENGIWVSQSENPFYFADTIRNLLKAASDAFDWHGIFVGTVPTYPGSVWTWTWAGRGTRPTQPVRPAPAGLEAYTDGMFPRPDAVPPCVARLLPEHR